MLDKYERIALKKDAKIVGSSSGSDSDKIVSAFTSRKITENCSLKKIDHHFTDWRECIKYHLQ